MPQVVFRGVCRELFLGVFAGNCFVGLLLDMVLRGLCRKSFFGVYAVSCFFGFLGTQQVLGFQKPRTFLLQLVELLHRVPCGPKSVGFPGTPNCFGACPDKPRETRRADVTPPFLSGFSETQTKNTIKNTTQRKNKSHIQAFFFSGSCVYRVFLFGFPRTQK